MLNSILAALLAGTVQADSTFISQYLLPEVREQDYQEKFRKIAASDCGRVSSKGDAVICEDKKRCKKSFVNFCFPDWGSSTQWCNYTCGTWEYETRWEVNPTSMLIDPPKGGVPRGVVLNPFDSFEDCPYGTEKCLLQGAKMPELPYVFTYHDTKGQRYALRLRFQRTAVKMENLLREYVLHSEPASRLTNK